MTNAINNTVDAKRDWLLERRQEFEKWAQKEWGAMGAELYRYPEGQQAGGMYCASTLNDQ